MAVGYPSFTAIKEGGDTDRLVYGNFCGRMKILVMKDSTPKSSKGNWCLFNAALNFIVDATVLSKNTPQIYKRWHYWKLFIPNSEGR